MKHILLAVLFVLFIPVLICSLAVAGTTGKIAGKITDRETGEALPGVNVLIVGTKMGAATDVNGEYYILNIPVGTYSVRASFIGYQTVTVENVKVVSDLTTKVDFALPSEAIELKEIVVSAERPLIQKDATSTVTVIDASEIQVMPVSSFTEAMVLTTGFVETQNGGDNGIHLRGARTGEITYIVDGVRVDNPLFGGLATDVTRVGVAELTVLAGTFNAEYGQAQSGVVNIVTQEGKDKYAGTVRFNTDRFGSDRNDWGTMQEEVSLTGPAIPGLRIANFFGSADWLFTRTYLNKSTGPEYMTPGGRVIQRHHDFGLYNNRFRGTGKLTVRPTGNFRIQAGVNVTDQKSKGYSHYFKELPEFNGIDVDQSKLYNLFISHAITPSTFYELKASYFEVTDQHYLFEEGLNGNFRRIFSSVTNAFGFDSTSNYEFAGRYGITLPANYAAEFGYPLRQDIEVDNQVIYAAGTPLTPEIAADLIARGISKVSVTVFSMDNFLRDAQSITRTISANVSSQLNKWNLVKAGFEYKRYKVKDRWISGINEFWNYVEDPNDASFVVPEKRHYEQVHYNFSPLQMAAYVQDKLEFEDFILNLGLRFDYLDTNAPDVYAFLQDPTNPLLREKKVGSKTHLSPRIGLSFPITDRAKFHAAFGQFYEYADFNFIYRRFRQNTPNYPLPDLSVGFWPIIGNPDIKPETSNAYELGGELMINEDLVGRVTVSYKDTYDYISTRLVDADPFTYTEIVNLDYANSRSIEISLRRRFSNHFSFVVNYTFSRAEGNADNWAAHWDEAYTASVTGLIPPKKTVTLAWDQPHTVTFSVFVGYDTWGVNFIGDMGSGLPYTPQDARGSLIGEINSGRQPWTANVDVRAYKTVRLGFTKTTLFVDVANIFNKKNILNVFNNSGKPDYSTNPNTSPENMHRPLYFGPMRHVSVGVELGF